MLFPTSGLLRTLSLRSEPSAADVARATRLFGSDQWQAVFEARRRKTVGGVIVTTRRAEQMRHSTSFLNNRSYIGILHESARNFNPLAGMAAAVTIAEVEQLVEPGEIRPEDVHLPGVFVQRVVEVGTEGKGIEFRTTRPRSEATR